jgi:hypothetical protein
LGHELDFIVLEEFYDFTLNYEEKLFGGIGNWDFLGVCSWFHVGLLRRGTIYVSICVFGELSCKYSWGGEGFSLRATSGARGLLSGGGPEWLLRLEFLGTAKLRGAEEVLTWVIASSGA